MIRTIVRRMQVRPVVHLDGLIRPVDVILTILEIGVFERGDRRDRAGSSFVSHNVP